MIEVDGVYKSFGATQVLKGVTFIIPRGSTRVILGLSGSGKSVLMKLLIGLMRPDRGKIAIDGQDITHLGHTELLGVRRKFGMVFQQAALFDSMNVGDNVAFALREHTKLRRDDIDSRVQQTLAMVGLSGLSGKLPSELSGGMRKRVGLARAVVLDPAYIFYDEPTTGLDPLTTDTVDAMIMDAKRHFNATSVVISHDVGSALKVADDIAVIHQGIIVEDCPAIKIRQSPHPFVQQFLQSWYGKQ